MPLYHYAALSKEGKKTKGVVQADSYSHAKELLHRQKIFVTTIFNDEEGKKAPVLKAEGLLFFTRDLALLLKAGLHLYESLMAIQEKYSKHPSQAIFLDLCDKIKHGKLLSQALRSYPKVFDQIYVAMVASGEETGSLAEVMLQLNKLLERQSRLRKQWISSMIYPLFLLIFCTVVVVALFFFLIPSMQQLFEGRELHPVTQAILSISVFLRTYGALLGFGLGAALVACGVFFSRPQGKMWLQKMVLKISFLGKLVTQAVFARFCRALSIMLASNVPLIEALKLSKRIMNHSYFE